MLIRPTTIIVMIAFWAVLFFRGNWKVFGKIAAGDRNDDGICLCRVEYSGQSSKVVPILKEEGLAKGPLLFINLGLTDMGHNQEDMKRACWLISMRTSARTTIMVSSKRKMSLKKSKRRLKGYGPFGLIGHIYYKQSLTVAEGHPGLAVSRCTVRRRLISIHSMQNAQKIMDLLNGCEPYFLSTGSATVQVL